MATFTDDFERADSTNLGASWTEGGNLQILSGVLSPTTNGNVRAAVNTEFTAGNIYAQVKLTRLPSSEWAPGPQIRGDSVANTNAFNTYNVYVNYQGAFRLRRFGTAQHTSAAGVFSSGDTIRLEDRGGGEIVVMKNGTDIYTYNDGTPLTGGYIGLFSEWSVNSGTTFQIDDFEGGDLVAASTVYPQSSSRLVGTGSIGQGNGFGYKRF